MTTAQYCSTVCLSKCCRVHDPVVAPEACPKLDKETGLCTIYEERLGFVFRVWTKFGKVQEATCRAIEDALPELPEEVREGCCYWRPELLEAPEGP